ncbi:MAG TPA: peptidoglycan DD-metalloendopeptidase family protein [Chitinophagaceae bacterium]|nr:peptidoglycan DD-metalloendopeptidase family protein [Chitinophagaceae bacterium]
MKKISILFFNLFFGLVVFAQSDADKARMENERKALQKELKEIQGVYNQVKGKKKETIGQLNLLQKKMSLQGRYIGNINKEINLITNDIYVSSLEINKLKKQLDTLKSQYARSVVYAYKNRSNFDYLNFIFSASTFNDALKRIAYLRSYRAYRQEQVNNIIETQKAIEDRKQQLLGKKTQKTGALQNQKQQLDVLEDQKKEKDVVVAKLKSKENELQKQITSRKKKDAQLKNSIAAIIRREIEARRKEEETERKRLAALEKANPSTTTASVDVKAPAKKTGTSIPLNAKEVALSSSFSSNKGKLPWPVDDGYVSIPYGTYSVPGTSLKGYNSGLTISTPSPGTNVKAVFDGEVLSVFNLGDGTMAVMLSHGKFFTVYSNLSGTSVGKGSNVKTGQSIGRAAADDEGGSGGKLDFTLMIEKKETNPSPWLRR